MPENKKDELILVDGKLSLQGEHYSKEHLTAQYTARFHRRMEVRYTDYAWRGYENRFVVSAAGWKAVWNKSRQEMVFPRVGWKTRLIIKWMPNQRRFDAISVTPSRRGNQFRTIPLLNGVMQWFPMVAAPEMLTALWEWMEMMPLSDFDRKAIFGTEDREHRLIYAQAPLVRGYDLGHRDTMYVLSEPIRHIVIQPNLELGLKKAFPGFKFPKRFRRMAMEKVQNKDLLQLSHLDRMILCCGFDHIIPVGEALEDWSEFSTVWMPDHIDQFNALSLARKLRVVTAENGLSHYCDAIRMSNSLRTEFGVEFDLHNYPDPREAHDAVEALLAPLYRERRRTRNRLFDYSTREIPQEAYEPYVNLELPDGLRLVSPKVGQDLVGWSNAMDNCIRGYQREAVEGYGIYLGIMDGDELIGNIEIRGRTLSQILGKHNRTLPNAEPIHDALVEAGLINPSYQAWGLREHW